MHDVACLRAWARGAVPHPPQRVAASLPFICGDFSHVVGEALGQVPYEYAHLCNQPVELLRGLLQKRWPGCAGIQLQACLVQVCGPRPGRNFRISAYQRARAGGGVSERRVQLLDPLNHLEALAVQHAQPLHRAAGWVEVGLVQGPVHQHPGCARSQGSAQRRRAGEAARSDGGFVRDGARQQVEGVSGGGKARADGHRSCLRLRRPPLLPLS
mmetsp:Transcript_12555/g.23841  ORF Transcript_12555/g.23841 Transcript_12555/m.23841 type:complete len:213 (-) Transcript_12555:671-1309(-)